MKNNISELKIYKMKLEEYLEIINSNMNILDKEVHKTKIEITREINRVKRLIKSEIAKELI